MDKSELERALKLGLGRAILHLKAHPNAPYRDLILDVCLHTTVYDGQIEGSRKTFLYEVIRSTNDYDWYRERILRAFADSPASEEHDFSHLFALVQHIAANGDSKARESLYAKVREGAASGWDYACDMLELDGVPGLVFVAGLGPVDREEWEYEILATTLLEDHSDQANEESLRSALSEYPDFLEPLLEALKDRATPDSEEDRAARMQAIREERAAEIPAAYAEIKKLIADATDTEGRLRRIMQFWGIDASDDDLRQAALDLEEEQDDARLLAYLNIFYRQRFPLEPDRLIAIATQYIPSISERGDSGQLILRAFIAMRVLKALAHIHHSKVRTFALSLMDDPQTMDWAVEILSENFEHEDWQLIALLTERHKMDREDYHGLGMAVRHVFKHHPYPDAVPALLNLYEHSPCSHCRYTVVGNLHSLNALPDWMIRECAHDSYSHTREFIEKEVLKT